MTEKSLGEMQVGEKGSVSRIAGEGQVRRRLLDMGVTPRAVVAVERIAPLGDPIWIRLRGYQLSLRKHEAAGVFVEVA
jgi:Fe2+ transport system protein FeoA